MTDPVVAVEIPGPPGYVVMYGLDGRPIPAVRTDTVRGTTTGSIYRKVHTA